MPYRKWTVEPVFVGRKPQPPDKVLPDCEFEHFTNGTLVKCIHQLSSILTVADRIFDEISAECRLVYERAQRISHRIENCQGIVENFNARAVQVPVSDLSATRKFLRKHPPYRAVKEQPCQLFLPSNRPQCIDKLYNEACTTPVSVICTIDRFRTDGCTSSELFMVTPVLGGNRRKKKRYLFDIECRKPANLSFAASDLEDENLTDGSLERTLVSPSAARELKQLERLPSPEELTLAVSLEYPSSVVPVDTSGNSFMRMLRCRRSLIHTDFEIKRKKNKHKSKRRHTVCEGNNKDLEEALQKITMTNSSCQTEEPPESTSLFSFRRSFSRRRKANDAARRGTVALDDLNLDLIRKDSDGPVQDQSKKDSLGRKSGKGSLMSRAAKINPISSLSAAISMAVKMRHSKSKQDDGRSSSGNWSASSSTRASIDSDQQHAVMLAVERNSNLSRSSIGKDSVLSDATTVTATLAQYESSRNQDQTMAPGGNEHSRFLSNRRRLPKGSQLWEYERGRESNASTPERNSDCASTPLVMSPYTNRRNHSYASNAFDDGDSSVYSVDTDGYYTSMHTDSGLWNVINGLRNGDNQNDSIKRRQRQESQSSVSTIGNGSINSFLSKIVTETENSSTCSSLKKQKPAPDPPPRLSSFAGDERDGEEGSLVDAKQIAAFEKENSPPKNGSASESDYESRDRIRVKTTINSSRYPSLCAVSPETSDDELADAEKSKTLTKTFVVAEVHREDEAQEVISNKNTSSIEGNDETLTNSQKTHVINMYGGSSPTESSFSSSLLSNNKLVASTPKQKGLFSFTSDTNSAVRVQPMESQSLVQKLLFDLKNIPSPNKDLAVSNVQASPKNIRNTESNLIPLKYAQRITVTPIVRHESVENNNQLSSRSKSFLKNPLSNLSFRNTENLNSKPKSPSYVSFQSPDSPVSSSTSLTPDAGVACTPTMKKAVARVTLDPMGKVIYSSSSLERNKNESPSFNSRPVEAKYSTFPKTYAHPRNVKTDISSTKTTSEQNKFQSKQTTGDFKSKTENFSPTQQSTTNFPSVISQSPNPSPSQNLLFRPSRGGRFCRTYFPSHIISPTSGDSSSTTKSDSPYDYRFAAQRTAQQQSQRTPSSPNNANIYSQHPPSSPTTNTPSPKSNVQRHNTYYAGVSNSNLNASRPVPNQSPISSKTPDYSFRPVTPQQEMLSAYSNPAAVSYAKNEPSAPTSGKRAITSPTSNYASSPLLSAYSYQQSESKSKISEYTPTNPPDVIPSSSTPPSTLDITARTVKKEGGFLSPNGKTSTDPSNLKSLSSSELFAIIHNSKKKHNIKTDSEKSLSPMSSRSSSPGICMMSSPAKTPKIETGVLGRFNKDRNNSASPKTVESSANDRFGRSKPTSMHDFKMLLLQARVGGNESTPRPSAAELLKVSPTRDSGRKSPNTLPRTTTSSPSPRYQPSPTVHSTIPVKRATRTRSPFLTRYDSTYPPIWEDCSEDMEAADENQNSFATLPSREGYLSRATQPYGRSVLDNEKSNARATTTWV